MKCKHCYKGYKNCPYYNNEDCTYKKEQSFIEDMKVFEAIYEIDTKKGE